MPSIGIDIDENMVLQSSLRMTQARAKDMASLLDRDMMMPHVFHQNWFRFPPFEVGSETKTILGQHIYNQPHTNRYWKSTDTGKASTTPQPGPQLTEEPRRPVGQIGQYPAD